MSNIILSFTGHNKKRNSIIKFKIAKKSACKYFFNIFETNILKDYNRHPEVDHVNEYDVYFRYVTNE